MIIVNDEKGNQGYNNVKAKTAKEFSDNMINDIYNANEEENIAEQGVFVANNNQAEKDPNDEEEFVIYFPDFYEVDFM